MRPNTLLYTTICEMSISDTHCLLPFWPCSSVCGAARSWVQTPPWLEFSLSLCGPDFNTRVNPWWYNWVWKLHSSVLGLLRTWNLNRLLVSSLAAIINIIVINRKWRIVKREWATEVAKSESKVYLQESTQLKKKKQKVKTKKTNNRSICKRCRG